MLITATSHASLPPCLGIYIYLPVCHQSPKNLTSQDSVKRLPRGIKALDSMTYVPEGIQNP